MSRRIATLCTGLVALTAASVAVAQPQYTIVNLGTVNAADSFVQGVGISPGGVAFGRSIGSVTRAFSWTQGGGIVGLGTIAGRNFYVANGANDNGVVVGNGATTLSGSSALPIIWNNG